MLKINIDTSNGIFRDDTDEECLSYGGRMELGRLLRGIAEKIENGADDGIIIEGYGNRCGDWTLDENAYDIKEVEDITGTKYVGKYNIDYSGAIYDGNQIFEMVIIMEFTGDEPIECSKKVLFFLNEAGKTIVPEFRSEEEVEKFLCYKNYQKIKIYKSNTIVLID